MNLKIECQGEQLPRCRGGVVHCISTTPRVCRPRKAHARPTAAYRRSFFYGDVKSIRSCAHASVRVRVRARTRVRSLHVHFSVFG